jgi:hypothetical protein
MQKWEYAYIRFDTSSGVVRILNDKAIQTTVHWLDYANEMGVTGWELVATSGKYGDVLIFKRPQS